MRSRFVLVLLVSTACGAPAGFENRSCADVDGACEELSVDAADTLLETANRLAAGTLVLGAGTFDLSSQVTLRGQGITLWGQGAGETILNFASQSSQGNGIDVVGDDFEIGFLTIVDAVKDGLRIEDSTNVHIHHLEVTWSAGISSDNGAYGVYPVRSTNVLLEDCHASFASDAGIYVGQVQNAIVRRNTAKQNVTGIEIENTQFADVYDNIVEGNTAGLLVFDLPGNPIVGRDIRLFDNIVRNNNEPNFAAPGSVVARVPAGTGTFAMASRRVEIFNNLYQNNDTTDIALLSGLVLTQAEGPHPWAIPREDLVGYRVDDLPLLQTADFVTNFQTFDIYVHNNSFEGGSGDSPDPANLEFGLLFALLYGDQSVENIVYDAIGESSFDSESDAGNSNDNNICVRNNTSGSFVSLNLPQFQEGLPPSPKLYRPAANTGVFACSSLRTGPIAPVDLPFGD